MDNIILNPTVSFGVSPGGSVTLNRYGAGERLNTITLSPEEFRYVVERHRAVAQAVGGRCHLAQHGGTCRCRPDVPHRCSNWIAQGAVR